MHKEKEPKEEVEDERRTKHAHNERERGEQKLNYLVRKIEKKPPERTLRERVCVFRTRSF